MRYVIEPGEECPAIVTQRNADGTINVRLVLSERQVSKYGRDGWWNPEYLRAMALMPWECFIHPGFREDQWYDPAQGDGWPEYREPWESFGASVEEMTHDGATFRVGMCAGLWRTQIRGSGGVVCPTKAEAIERTKAIITTAPSSAPRPSPEPSPAEGSEVTR